MVRAVDLGKLGAWQARLRRFAESGLSIGRFCREEGVSAPSFYSWRKRLAKNRGSVGSASGPAAGPSFVPVRLMAMAAPPIVIRLPNGVRVRLPGDNIEALRAGIEAAAALSGAASMAAGKEASRC
jgi:transposase-like protein